MTVETIGIGVASGTGAAALGSPANCVAWLANTLSELGAPLKAGEIVLSGSLTPLLPIRAGDRLLVRGAGIGQAEVRFDRGV